MRRQNEALASTYGWDEMLDNKPAPKIASAWACNCPILSNSRCEPQTLTHMYPTEVVEDGICRHCGHYAFRMDVTTLHSKKQRNKFTRF